MFEELHLAVSQLAITSDWEDQDLPNAYPDDFPLGITDPVFIKFGVTNPARRKPSYDTTKLLQGTITFSIFYEKNRGRKYPSQVADKLSQLLENKLFVSGKLQTFTGNLQFLGDDPEDPTLSRADFSVPFNFSGE